jgi:hypothetical protein
LIQIRQSQLIERQSESTRKEGRLMFGVSGIKLSQNALRTPVQHLFGEDSQELETVYQLVEPENSTFLIIMSGKFSATRLFSTLFKYRPMLHTSGYTMYYILFYFFQPDSTNAFYEK